MNDEDVIETLERLLHHNEAQMQEWSIKNGEPGSIAVHGVELGYVQEVEALRAALDTIHKHGVARPEVHIKTNLA